MRESEAEEGDGADVTMTSVLKCGRMCFISSKFSVLSQQ